MRTPASPDRAGNALRQRRWIAAAIAAAALLAFASAGPGLRRRFIQDVITWDAEPRPPVALPAALGIGLPPAARVRVVLIDGLGPSAAQTLPTWRATCARGLQLAVDVGFPTVSLPVQVALWTGLTQQQTGVVFRSDRPLVPPLTGSIPARVPGSRAIAESHGYIVRSLGFSSALPEADPVRPAKDRDREAWNEQWERAAREAIASEASLVFVHVLRVDVWGHRRGPQSAEYLMAAIASDAILASLIAAAPDARWFVLSDHAHVSGGGHGGEEHAVRQVEHCIAGPGVTPGRGGPIHLVDVSRALADSLGLAVASGSPARPLSGALAAPLDAGLAVPALALGTGALASFLLALGIGASVWAVRRWWLAPWWFALACALLLVIRGEPTMSTPMTYAREELGDLFDPDLRLMMRSWLAALPLAAIATWAGLARSTLLRVLVAQLALPVAVLAAALTACGAWPALLGAERAPVVPHYTAYVSPLLLITAQGAAAVALAVLARTARSAFGRSAPAETPRSAP